MKSPRDTCVVKWGMQSVNVNPPATRVQVTAVPNGSLGAVPVWSSEDTSGAVIDGVNDAGTQATIAVTGKPGTFQIDVTEGDPANGGFVTSFDVIVPQQPATGFNFTFGTPF